MPQEARDVEPGTKYIGSNLPGTRGQASNKSKRVDHHHYSGHSLGQQLLEREEFEREMRP